MDVKEVIGDVAEKIQKNADVKAVFGEPVEKNGVTVIPVSRVKFCGCGKCGTGESSEAGADGLGMHFKNEPAGYIEIKEGSVQYVEIVNMQKVIMAGIALGAFSVFSLYRLLKKLMDRG